MDWLHNFLRPLLGFLAIGVTFAGALLASDQVWLICLGVIFVCLLYLVWTAVPTPARRAPTTSLTPEERERARQENLSHSVQLLAGFLLAGFLLLGAHLFRQQVAQASAISGSRVINVTTQISPNLYQRDTQLIRNGQSITFTQTIANPTPLSTGTDSLQNPRLLSHDLKVQRGQILDASGRVIAGRTVYSDTGYVQRTYPVDNMGYLLGFYNPTIYGLSGLESNYDDYLSGRAESNPLVSEEDRLLHRATVGSDVHLTLVPSIQNAATAALGARKGAVVVLDAQTGAVLALVSYPHFDPNGLAFNPNAAIWDAENKRIVDYWNSVANEKARPDLPMLDRATQGLYPPGSTFKTVTLAAAVDEGKVRPNTLFTDTGSLKVQPGSYSHVDCSTCRPANHPNNHFTLMEGYQWSLNVVFAELGVNVLGGDPLVSYGRRFGFERDYNQNNPAMGVPVEASRLFSSPNYLDGPNAPNDLAAISYGQGEMQATPLEMALVAATVARGGELPQPYLVGSVTAPNGSVVAQTNPASLDRAVSPDSDAILRQMMITSVQKGWANGATIPGYAVGGKTGTAETGRGTSHAWFIGFAGKDPNRPQYAVAAMVEEGGEGSSVAVPIARAALLAALTQK
ncbi:MAG: peptidoglycan D,D-transpeptidase FtsI family protein [Chloroflexia bacterium]